MTPHPLSSVQAVRVLAGREIRERAKTKAARWGTVTLCFLAAAAALLPQVLPDAADPEYDVLLAGSVPTGLVRMVESNGDASITLERTGLDPEEAARQGEVDAVLVDGAELVAEGAVPDRLETILTSSVGQVRTRQGLAELGVPADEAAGLFRAEPLEIRTLDGDDAEVRQGAAFVGTFVLFVAITIYGSWILNSVLEEKSNRIVEIVVSAIKPSELLAAKVLGVGLVGAAQLTLVAAVGAAAAAAAGTLPDLPDVVATSVAATLGWFVLGFGFYAVGYAAAASLTSRQEDAQNAVAPMTGLVIAAYGASLFLVNPAPESTMAKVVSFIPPVTPLAMPVRMANDAVAAWEVSVAVVVMLVATWLMTRLAARIYENALLRSGGRIQLLTAIRATRS